MVVGNFGGVLFTVSWHQVLTIEKYRRVTKHRFAVHDIVNDLSMLESVGQSADELSLDIKLVRSLGVNIELESGKLRLQCEQGRSDWLIIGGVVLGKFVIEELTEDVEQWSGAIPQVLKLSLKLKGVE